MMIPLHNDLTWFYVARYYTPSGGVIWGLQERLQEQLSSQCYYLLQHKITAGLRHPRDDDEFAFEVRKYLTESVLQNVEGHHETA